MTSTVLPCSSPKVMPSTLSSLSTTLTATDATVEVLRSEISIVASSPFSGTAIAVTLPSLSTVTASDVEA